MVNLKIYTSYISRESIEQIKNKNLLPIFILRSIGKIDYIEPWTDTPLHFRELSPSKELFWSFRDKEIDFETFQKKFLIELCELDFQDIITRLDSLNKTCGSNGVVLCGIGKNPEFSHRILVADILWRTGYLLQEPEELTLL